MIIHSKFRPSWWLSNPHLQTIYASKLSKRPEIEFNEERLELPDGDFLDLNHSTRDSGPIVCLFHGLAGCINSGYAQGIFHALEQRGMRPVFMHWRGCSGEPNRLARSYHSGSTDDIRTVITLMQNRFPFETIMAAGFSIGANALLVYLGEEGANCPLSAAVAVCPPLVLQMGANKLNSGLAKGYQRYLLNQMRSQHEAKRLRYPELKLPEAGAELDTFWKFDDVITSPIHGFKDVHDYYAQCSSRQYLPRVRVPTHILYALDDPFFTPDVLPGLDELGPRVVLEKSQYGGHIGFVSGNRIHEPEYWLDGRIAQLLEDQLSPLKQHK